MSDAVHFFPVVTGALQACNLRPDFIVEMEVRIPFFEGQTVIVRAPIMVEIEAGAGFDGARRMEATVRARAPRRCSGRRS